MVAVVPDGGESPLGPSWQAVMTHISDRLSWVDPDFKLQVPPVGRDLSPSACSTPLIMLCVRRCSHMQRATFRPMPLLLPWCIWTS